MCDANSKVINMQLTPYTVNAFSPTVSPRLNYPAIFYPFRPHGPYHGWK
jgi:hypothetical protein